MIMQQPTMILLVLLPYLPFGMPEGCKTSTVPFAKYRIIANGRWMRTYHCADSHTLVNQERVYCRDGKLVPAPICARWCFTSDILRANDARTVHHGDLFNSANCLPGFRVEKSVKCINGTFEEPPKCIMEDGSCSAANVEGARHTAVVRNGSVVGHWLCPGSGQLSPEKAFCVEGEFIPPVRCV